MLWNGGISTPRFIAQRCRKRSSSGSAASWSAVPFLGGEGRKWYSARAPSRVTCQGTSFAESTPFTPSSNRSASAIIRANASSVRTEVNVAQIAASESALPASVPPIPPTSESSRSIAR